MAMRPSGSVLFLIALTLGCAASGNLEPVGSQGRSQPLTVGSAFRPYPNGSLRVSLTAVESDTRCPLSVVCVSAGEATVRIGIRRGTIDAGSQLLTWGVSRRDAVVDGLRLSLDSLTPWPAVPGPLQPQSAYTAWIGVTVVRD